MIFRIAAMLLSGAAVILTVHILIPGLVRNLLKRRFLARVGKNGRFCLTFDDGPEPNVTPGLLDLLDAEAARATFFVSGAKAEKHPGLLGEMDRRGHEVGGHGYRHVHPWYCLPFSGLADLVRGSRAVGRCLGSKKDRLLRPPYGKLNFITMVYFLLARRTPAFWDIDAKDYLPRPPEDAARKVLDQLSSGSVILLHEIPADSGEAAGKKIELTRSIIRRVKENGRAFATVSEALEDKG
jgi:peptidoglycan/xylan/chitin deacetylase (PgdA/CDA1 family)